MKTLKKLQKVTLSSKDFETVIYDASDAAFLFIDPPYFNADQDKFYAHSFSHDDHMRLANLLREHRNRLKFLITYDNTDEVRSLYTWATGIYDKEWNYTINRTDDQRKHAKKRKGMRYKGKNFHTEL